MESIVVKVSKATFFAASQQVTLHITPCKQYDKGKCTLNAGILPRVMRELNVDSIDDLLALCVGATATIVGAQRTAGDTITREAITRPTKDLITGKWKDEVVREAKDVTFERTGFRMESIDIQPTADAKMDLAIAKKIADRYAASKGWGSAFAINRNPVEFVASNNSQNNQQSQDDDSTFDPNEETGAKTAEEIQAEIDAENALLATMTAEERADYEAAKALGATA